MRRRPTTSLAQAQFRNAKRYAKRMAQFVVRLDESLVDDVDHMVQEGVFANRSEATRVGLRELVDRHRRRRIGAEIADAYRRRPQTVDELAGLEQATRALIAEEPW